MIEFLKKHCRPETISLAQQIADAGMVIALSQRPNGFNAKIAAQRGRLMQVDITLSPEQVHNRCSCGVSGAPCEHAAAALLAWEKRFPDSAQFFLNTKEEDLAPTQPPITISRSSTPSLESLLLNLNQKKAGLEVFVTSVNPTLFTLEINITYEKRKFSSSNFKSLTETGTGPAKLTIDHFDIDDREIMNLLADLPKEGRLWTVKASLLNRVLKLRQGRKIKLEGEIVQVIADDLQAGLRRTSENDGFAIIPAFQLDTLVDVSEFELFYLHDGIWALLNHNLWKVNDKLPYKTMKKWFDDGKIHLPRLPEGDFILPLFEDNKEIIKDQSLQPRLILDWQDISIKMDLFFDYGDVQCRYNEETYVIPCGSKTICRDRNLESEFIEAIEKMGFVEENNYWWIAGFDKIVAFAMAWKENRLPLLWNFSCSPSFQKALLNNQVASLTVKTENEGQQLIDVDLKFRSQDEHLITWNDLQKAVQLDKEFVFSEDGTLIRIENQLKETVAALPELNMTNRGKVQFPRHHALLISTLLQRFFDPNEKSSWSGLYDMVNGQTADLSQLDKSLTEMLRDYQVDGLHWLINMKNANCGAILADEMGLGKTIQTLSMLASLDKTEPCLIVCPSSLMENWQKEAKRFTPDLKTCIISGDSTERKKVIGERYEYDMLITSYSLLRRDMDLYSKVRFDTVVLDEAQQIKNHRSQSALSCRSLQADSRLALTGTPLENSAADLWSVFEFLSPSLLGSKKNFEAAFKEDQVNPKAQYIALKKLRPFILRRLKKDVLPQLPPKQEQVIEFKLSDQEQELYKAIAENFLQDILQDETAFSKRRLDILSLITRLRQTCSHPALLPEDFKAQEIESSKFKLFQELVEEIRDSSHRALVFSQFTSMLSIMRDWLDEQGIKYCYLDGSTKKRQDLVDQFNEDEEIQFFLLSLKAGGTGLNLTGADTVIHYDNWWNPMVVNQASDRAHRIGQTRNVNIIKLVAQNTIEEKIIQLQKTKEKLFDQLVEGSLKSSSELSENDIRFLLG